MRNAVIQIPAVKYTEAKDISAGDLFKYPEGVGVYLMTDKLGTYEGRLVVDVATGLTYNVALTKQIIRFEKGTRFDLIAGGG